MKKALSLFLALVMVALMIPFAAFVTSAAGEAKSTTANSYTTDGSTYWSWDFTKVTSLDAIPTGFGLSATDGISVSDNGLKIDSTSVSLKMTNLSAVSGFDVFNSSQNYTITTRWFTDHKFNHVGFYVGADGATPGYRFQLCGGPNANGALVNNAELDGYIKWHNNNSVTSTTVNEKGTALTQADLKAIYSGVAAAGGVFTTSLEVVAGKLVRIHISVGSDTVTYNLSRNTDVVKGFGISLGGSWSGSKVTVKSVAIEKGAYNGHVELPDNAEANVIHNYNIANAADIDAIPYDTYSGDGYGEVSLKDGVLWQTLKKNDNRAYNSMIKIDEEYFAGLSTYTLDFTLAGGSAARIFFVSFGLNDDRNSYSSTTNEEKGMGYGFYDGHDFKLRIGNNGEASDWASDSHKTWFKDASTGKYVAASEAKDTTLPDAMIAALEEGKSDIFFRVVVENNRVSNAYVTVDGITVIMTVKGARTAPAGDVALIQQPASAQVDKSFGLKSVTIYDKAIYADTVAATEQIVTPAGKAVVKNGSEATVVNAGTEITDAIAMKTNGVLGEVVDTFTAVAGNVYAPITKAGIAASKLTAADAELRLGANPGMRYKTSFAGSDFDLIMALTALDTPVVVDVKMGTLVTVDTYLEGAGAFTADALKAYGEAQGKNVYMDITADAAALYAENTFAGSVISVKDFTRNYVARAYITVTFADATTATIYADATDAVSIKGLAAAIVAAEYAGYTTDAEKAALDFLATFGDVAA